MRNFIHLFIAMKHPFYCLLCLWAVIPIFLHAASSPVSVPTDTLRVETSRRGHLTNSLDVLQGQAAGVTVGSNTNPEAMLSSVRVRGNHSLTGGNEPLVIIDGMSSDLSTMASIYPGDIESVTILKDAAQTAQYGARGAAGVIEVRTHRGMDGRFHVSYAGDVGCLHADTYLPMLNAAEYRDLTGRLGLTIVDNGYNTDWQRAITRTGIAQNHHLAFGGGSEQSRYRASLSFSQNNSIIPTIGTQNFTAKVDLTQYALDRRLKIDLGLFGAMGQNKYINSEQKLFYSAAAFNPTFSAERNASGGYDGYADASQINHPLALLDIKRHNESMHFNTHLRLTGDIGYGLTVSAYGSYSYAADDDSYFYPTYIESTGMVYRGAGKTINWLGNISLNYAHSWGTDHQLKASVLGEMQSRKSSGFHTTINRLASNAYGYDNLAIGGLRLWNGTGSTYEKVNMASVMAQASYTALDRYTLSVTARADGTSLAAKGHQWGVFPSVGLSWNIKNEPWLQDADILNKWRLNMGYGLSGNMGGISAYQSLNLLYPTGLITVNGLPTTLLSLTGNANADLTWEKTRTANVGTEIALWQNRFVFTADYYYSYIYDMLYNYTVPVPPFIYDHLTANLGRMENQGLEFGVGIAAVQTADWGLNISVNLAWQQNKLISLNGYYDGEYLTAPTYTPIAGLNGAGLHGGNTNVVYQIQGQPLGVFYLPHCTGLGTAPDGTRYYEVEDIDRDGAVNLADGNDRRVCGQATPKVLMGSNISLRYKQFDLSVQLNGAFGHHIYNGSALSYMNLGSLPYYNVLKGAEKTFINDLTVTDYWLERGDYVNIDYLTLGWNMECKPEWKISAFRVSLSVNNLATITAYSGLTPIINSSVINSTLGVDDKRSFPVTRTYSLALQIQF